MQNIEAFSFYSHRKMKVIFPPSHCSRTQILCAKSSFALLEEHSACSQCLGGAQSVNMLFVQLQWPGRVIECHQVGCTQAWSASIAGSPKSNFHLPVAVKQKRLNLVYSYLVYILSKALYTCCSIFILIPVTEQEL